MADDYFEDLPPEAAKQQIAAKFADPAFMKVYTGKRWAGHAEAVAEMARLFEQAYPPGEGYWPRLSEALRLLSRMLGISIGRAGAMICAACAERLIRWECNFYTPTVADWQTGHIDARGDLVTESRRYDGMRLSGDDLVHWLRQQKAEPEKSRPDGRSELSGQGAKPGGKAATREQIKEIAKGLGKWLSYRTLDLALCAKGYAATPAGHRRAVLKEMNKPRKGGRIPRAVLEHIKRTGAVTTNH